MSNTLRSNMMLASTAPRLPPNIWTAMYATSSLAPIPVPARLPSAQSDSDTAGLKWAPDTGPKSRIRTARPNAVAVEFSSSCSPMSLGDSRAAAMPEPTTIATSRALPAHSARSRRANLFRVPITVSAARRSRRGAKRLGVRENRVDLPLLGGRASYPHLVLGGKTTCRAELLLSEHALPSESGDLLVDLVAGFDLHAEMIDRAAVPRVLQKHKFQRWLFDGEVGVAVFDLGRRRVEQLRVKRDRLVEVVDIEGELNAG